jgi:Carboxypeptidase regulatory-like domain/TonB dependent receptor
MQVPTFLAVLALSFYPWALHAQSTNASLTGRVTDPSKATIAEAKVAAVNTGTNFQYDTATNSAGEYTLANLPPGTYRIEVEKSGFKKLVRPEVILHVQDALAMDFELSLGATTETVTVQGGAPLVNTTSATVSTVVDQTFVENMPLNGRSFQTLIMLTPGVVVTQTAFDDQGQFSVNGQRADANYFTVDGVSANFGVTGYFPLVQTAGGALPALSASGGTNSLVSIDAMQEFRVQTSSFAPEFGRTPGGQISILTRSGSNHFHGTAFEYFRNDVLDANDWFSNRDHLPKPAARQNDFGGVFGGPILKDKTFFFFSYEGLRLRQPATQETVVPDTASRQKAPSTMQPYLNAYPVPNGAELGSGLAQFNGSYSNPSSLDAYSIRVDHGINSKLSLFGRYNYSPSQSSIRGAFGVLNTIELLSPSVQTFTVGLAYAITPQFSNELRANYSNDRVGLMYTLDGFGGAAPLPDSALFPPGFSSKNSDFLFYVSGIGEYALGRQATDEQRQVNLVDNLSIAKGGHQMKFGVDYRWLSPFVSPLAYGTFTEFTGMGTTTGGALSGTAAFADVAVFQADALLEHNFSFYGQDTWKLNPRLTLTYGLRWDINPPLKGKNLENQPFTATNLNDPAKMALAPRGTALYETTYGNVAPRIGVAYQLRQNPDWTTALRGGFGVFYDLGYGSLGGVSSYFPYRAQNNFFSTPYPLSPQQAAPPALTTNLPASEFVVADRNLKLPRTYEWNVAVEQSLATNQTISLTYVGARGDDLLRVTNIINPNPSFGQVSLTNNTAESYYHALQIKLQRRFSRGLHALASYTFSHSIDNASTDAFANYLNTPNGGAYTSSDRGNSDFDVRHSFTADVFYDLPTPKWNSFARASLGGWSVDAFVLARSAPPVNVVGAPYFGPGGTALYPRPNVVSGVPQVLYGPQYPGGKAFNNTVIPGACPGGANQVGAWCPAPPGTQGDFGRNVLRGFGATQADVALQRRFQLTEQLNLRFRAEFFNIFNHPNFSSPNNNLTDSFFGHSTQTLANGLGSGGANGGFNPLYQIGGPRSIQLALKLAF